MQQNSMASEISQNRQQSSLQSFYQKTERYNIDNSSKKRVFLFWIVFSLLLVIIFFTSFYTPETFIVKTNGTQLSHTHHQNCQNPVSFENNTLYCQQFSQKYPWLGLLLKNLTPLNQFAQINVLFIPKKQQSPLLKMNEIFSIELISLRRKSMKIDQNRVVTAFQKGQDVKFVQNLAFNVQNLQMTDILMQDQKTQKGYQINIGYYRQFKTEDALFIIKFQKIQKQLTQFYHIAANAILINPSYTKFIIIMRAVFTCITIASFIAFHIFSKARMFLQMPKQQRVVFILSILILFFNDPYYFIGIIKPNVISVFIESLFITVFVIGLLFSWVYLLRTINLEARQENYNLSKAQLIFSILISIVYFILIFLFNYEVSRFSYMQSPIVDFNKTFKLMKILTAAIFYMLLIYIIYQYSRLIAVWRNLMWRHKVYAIFNIFFIGLLSVFITAGWFSFYDESSQKFEILYASMNIYILYLQYSFTIAHTKGESVLNQQEDFKMQHNSASIKARYDIILKQGIVIDLTKSDNQKQLQVQPKIEKEEIQ